MNCLPLLPSIHRPSRDVRLEGLLRERFRRCPYLAVRHLACELQDGVAILRGSVPTYHTRQIAISLARGTDGVKAIDDRIHVSRSDTQQVTRRAR